MRRLAGVVLGAAVLGWLLAPGAAAGGGRCHSLEATEASGDRVVMRDFCFGPSILRAAPDVPVRFDNLDPAPHTVTGLGEWGSVWDEVKAGETLEIAFPNEGVYVYSCYYHPGMMGAVVVGDADGPGAGSGEDPTIEAAAAPIGEAGGDTPTTRLPAMVAVSVAGALVGALVVIAVVLRRRGRSSHP